MAWFGAKGIGPIRAFNRNVRAGLYPADWAGNPKLLVQENE